jgi:hypothetical protein
MRQLDWNEFDFLEFFEVEPIVLDEIVSHSYEAHRNGLRLLLTVWQLESVIQATLFQEGSEAGLFSFAVYVRGAAIYVDDERGQYLEITDCIVAPNRFWHVQAGDPFDRERFPFSVTVKFEVQPNIRIEFVEYRSTT